MLALKLIQDIQRCFKDPECPGSKVVTHLYKKHGNQVTSMPVALEHGYGYACGVSKTFAERVDRFVRIMGTCRDTLKALYCVNPDEVSSFLFLYDLGRAMSEEEALRRHERNPDSMETCGSTVTMVYEASIDLQLADRMNSLISNMPLLYRYLNGNAVQINTPMVLAANIIRMDKIAIESLVQNKVVIRT